MHDLSINFNRTLAADTSLTSVDLQNDQVWEFSSLNGEPPALSVQTTYGLRCRGITIFPRFTLQGTTLTDPRTFVQAGTIEKRYTNYLLVRCSPFPTIDVELEYWVPYSNSICGRMRVINHGQTAINFGCEWAVILRPHQKGEPMVSTEMGVNTVLKGVADELHPVFFLTGGPQPSTRAYPALALDMNLTAGFDRRVSWSLASLESPEASFTLARQNTALPWEADLLKQEMADKRQFLHFLSEDQVLDDFLLESQVKAHQCLIRGPRPDERMTLISKRLPDSPLGDFFISAKTGMSNLPATLYELWQISRILLPAQPEMVKELINTVLDYQQADGTIPWAVKPNGTPTKTAAPPLLAGITRDVYAVTKESAWLGQVYPPLLNAYKKWSGPIAKKSADHWPVWDHLLQTGLDSAPLYSVWNQSDQGVDLQYVDSPALGAMLFHECQALIEISQILEKDEELNWLQSSAAEIKTHVMAGWNEQGGTFRYRDIVTRQSLAAKKLFHGQMDGTAGKKITIGGERRLIVRCQKAEGFSCNAEVILKGRNAVGETSEKFRFNSSQFQDKVARITSQNLYTQLDSVEISGLQKGDLVQVDAAGFDDEDISLLVPLWAGIPSLDQAQALWERTIKPRYLSSFGLANIPLDRYTGQTHVMTPLWNWLIVEGLLKYGLREDAALVIKAALSGLTTQWKANQVMNDGIRTSDSQGIGTRENVDSLAAILPFLRALGIEEFQQKELLFAGLNEFLAPFTVQYGRVNVQLKSDCTAISTLNGLKIEIHDTGMNRSILP
jgi:hypothetical protein